jgi:hypothetical protein
MKYILILTLLTAIFSCTKPKLEVPNRKKLLQECYLDTIPTIKTYEQH